MALIDVNELLADPDFSDTLTVTRREQTIGDYGVAAFTETPVLGVLGSVQAVGKDLLTRVVDAGNPDDWIRIYTTFLFVTHDQATGRYGDVITWHGRQYQVVNTDDWTNWGGGYNKAMARLIPL